MGRLCNFSSSRFGLIIAAGGASTRFGNEDKLCADYHGLPLLCHCLKNLVTIDTPTVLVANQEHIATYQSIIDEHLSAMCDAIQIISGGKNRAESVHNGYIALTNRVDVPEVIAIHDAARPHCSRAMLMRCVEWAAVHGAALAGHRVTVTIHVCQEDGIIASTPSRSTLWAAETPQVFQTALLTQAYEELSWNTPQSTDEASLIARLPSTYVKIIENTEYNPKITYRHDIQ